MLRIYREKDRLEIRNNKFHIAFWYKIDMWNFGVYETYCDKFYFTLGPLEFAWHAH